MRRQLARHLPGWAFRLANRLRRVYWRVARPHTWGVRVMVLDGERVLLVQHTYDDRWNLPGGGYRPGRETVEAAAARELREELDMDAGPLYVLGRYEKSLEGRLDTVTCLASREARGTAAPAGELSAAAWFPLDGLPVPLASDVTRAVEFLLSR